MKCLLSWPKILILLIGALTIARTNTFNHGQFKQVVIWGHKLHSHSHSYIHEGFYRAFVHLGYNVLWIDSSDTITDIDFSNSLFITEGSVSANIPLRDDCKYILHNCDKKKYQRLFEQNNCLILQVYTHGCKVRNLTKLDDCIYFDPSEKTIYMPWATDLLPHEIDQNKKIIATQIKKRQACFIGNLQGGIFSNKKQFNDFSQACQKQNIEFQQHGHLTTEENMHLVQESLLAPAIQGDWQCENGYIPCRIFKNISYGAMGITNSKTVYEFFNNKIIYNANTQQLVTDALERVSTIQPQELFDLMDFVKNKHTYIHRIETLLGLLDHIKNIH